MRPLVLLRLAHRMQNRRGWTLAHCLRSLASERDITTMARRILK